MIWGLDLVGELVRLRGEVCGHLAVNLHSVLQLSVGLGCIMCKLTSDLVPWACEDCSHFTVRVLEWGGEERCSCGLEEGRCV